MERKYKYTIEEFDDRGDWLRSVNAYASRKRAEYACDRLQEEAFVEKSGKYYEVCEA